MTYFLMLLFVFVTLFILAINFLFAPSRGGVLFAFLWADLGTFFFHNMY